jgi:hypothetical protein
MPDAPLAVRSAWTAAISGSKREGAASVALSSISSCDGSSAGALHAASDRAHASQPYRRVYRQDRVRLCNSTAIAPLICIVAYSMRANLSFNGARDNTLDTGRARILTGGCDPATMGSRRRHRVRRTRPVM